MKHILSFLLLALIITRVSTINAQVFFYNTSYIVDTDVSGEYTSELYYNNKKSIAKLSLIRYSYSEPSASYRRGGGGNMTIGKIEVYDKKGEKLKFTTFFNSISPKSSSEIKLNDITFWDVNDAGVLEKDNNRYNDIYFKHVGNGSLETNLLNCATCTPYTYVLIKKYNGVPLIFEPLLNKLVQQNGQANNGLLVLGSGGYNTTLVSKKYNLRSDTINCYIKDFEEMEQYPYEWFEATQNNIERSMNNNEVMSYFPSAKCIKVYKSENYNTDYLFLITVNRNNTDKSIYNVVKSRTLEKQYVDAMSIKIESDIKQLKETKLKMEEGLARIDERRTELDIMMKDYEKTMNIKTKTGEPTEDQMKYALINLIVVKNSRYNTSANVSIVSEGKGMSVKMAGVTSEDVQLKIISFNKLSCVKTPSRPGCFSCSFTSEGIITGRMLKNNNHLYGLFQGKVQTTTFSKKGDSWRIVE